MSDYRDHNQQQPYNSLQGDVGVYPNTGSQAGTVISKDGYPFRLFAKEVTEMLKNPGSGRGAKSMANTAAK